LSLLNGLEDVAGDPLADGPLVLHQLGVQPGVHIVLVRLLPGNGGQVRPDLSGKKRVNTIEPK
jgi:hypothetical protein